jgi:hypothetical protein
MEAFVLVLSQCSSNAQLMVCPRKEGCGPERGQADFTEPEREHRRNQQQL